MIQTAPKTGKETIDNRQASRPNLSTATRAAVAIIMSLAAADCGNNVPNPFNTLVAYDAANDLSDASDGATQDTTLPVMDGLTVDTPDSLQMDATTEVITPIDATVDAQTTDVLDVSMEEPITDVPVDTTSNDSLEDTANEPAIVDARVEDVLAEAGLDVVSGEPDAASTDTQDVPDDQNDNGPDTGLADAADASDVLDRSDAPDVVDVPRDLPIDMGGDTGPDAGADASADAGVTTRVTYAIGAPSCTRVIIVGIPGCNPGDFECTYSRASGRQIQFIAEAVTIPPSPTVVNYSFYHTLSSSSPRLVFPVPNTPMATPTVSNGIYDVTMTPTIGAIAYASCRGPYIRVVN